MPSATLNPPQMQPILKRIAHATGAEVVFKSNCFEIHGLEQEVRAAVMKVLELEAIQVSHGHRLENKRLTFRGSTTRSDSRSSWPTSTVNSFRVRRMVKSTKS